MIQIVLVFSAAIVLEILGSYISVVGLSSKSSIILITLAISLDFAKIVIASVIYKNWKYLNILFKMFLLPTLIFLSVITSYGAYAFLLQEFGKTTANQVQITARIDSLTAEKDKLEKRKLEIDKQIADVPPQFVTQKRRLNELFAQEIQQVNTRITELDRQIPDLNQELLKDTGQAGTMGSLAKTWGTTPDQAAKILALMMVVVIDPLAIVLLMVGNFLQIRRVQELKLEKDKEEEKRILKEKEEKEFEKERLRILNEGKLQSKDEELKVNSVVSNESEVKQENNIVNSAPIVAEIVAEKQQEEVVDFVNIPIFENYENIAQDNFEPLNLKEVRNQELVKVNQELVKVNQDVKKVEESIPSTVVVEPQVVENVKNEDTMSEVMSKIIPDNIDEILNELEKPDTDKKESVAPKADKENKWDISKPVIPSVVKQGVKNEEDPFSHKTQVKLNQEPKVLNQK